MFTSDARMTPMSAKSAKRPMALRSRFVTGAEDGEPGERRRP